MMIPQKRYLIVKKLEQNASLLFSEMHTIYNFCLICRIFLFVIWKALFKSVLMVSHQPFRMYESVQNWEYETKVQRTSTRLLASVLLRRYHSSSHRTYMVFSYLSLFN